MYYNIFYMVELYCVDDSMAKKLGDPLISDEVFCGIKQLDILKSAGFVKLLVICTILFPPLFYREPHSTGLVKVRT